MTAENSYRQIVKSSSIMGGAASITLLLSIIRTKFVALLLGSTGLGLILGMTAIQGFIATLAGLGIQSSAVREIATAASKNDTHAISNTMITLRRICWISGVAGMMITVALSQLVSNLTFNSSDYTLEIAALGITVLMANVAGSQTALLQGMRRIGDMARANIFATIFSTSSSIALYYWLGTRGIALALICTATIQLATNWFYARKITLPPVKPTWRQSFREANGMVKLGLVLMWNGLMISAVNYIIVAVITREIDLHAAGLYGAAFTLSGIFTNFVLGAMSADYYPRLTSKADSKIETNRLVNEQTEIGLLLAAPGLLATLTLSPWAFHIFYTKEFFDAVELLQWFALGCLGRVISWPLGFVMLALGKGRWYLATETGANLAHLALVVIGLKWIGIEGVAIAFFILYLAYIATVHSVCSHLTGFVWSTGCRRIAKYVLPAIAGIFIAYRVLPPYLAAVIGTVTTLAFGIFCIRELVRKMGPESRAAQVLCRIPGAKPIFKLK